MNTENILNLASRIDTALLQGQEINRLTALQPELTLGDAYQIQDAGIRLRVGRGERPIGYKMGFTSKAKMEQMGLHSPIHGILTDSMQIADGGTLSLQGLIHPKIEPEVVFILGKDLKGKITAEEASAACLAVTAGLEILDSRYVGFKYFSLPDVVADNCSSSRFVMGRTLRKIADINLADLNIVMKINGEVATSASSSAILGNPLESLVELCRMLDEKNLGLSAGSLVFAGAATQAMSLENGMTVSAEIEELGIVSVNIGGPSNGH